MPMKEVKGDFRQMVARCLTNKHIDAICVMTNSVIKANGKATFTPEVLTAIPEVEFELTDQDGSNSRIMRTTLGARLGALMKDSRHKARLIGKHRGKHIVGLPHKFDWRDKEDLSLIEREAVNLVAGINRMKWKFLAMMRPVEDENRWNILKPKLEAIFSKTECNIGVFDGVPHNVIREPGEPEQPKPVIKDENPNQLSLGVDGKKPMPLKLFRDLSPEEKKAKRSEWAKKGVETRRNKNRTKVIEAELSSMLEELD